MTIKDSKISEAERSPEDDAYGVFQKFIVPDPRPTYAHPLIRLGSDGGELVPEFVVIDTMGNEVVLKKGARIRDCRLEGWDLAGLRLEELHLDTVALVGCRLQNTELVGCVVNRLLIDGGLPGFVIKDSEVNQMCVTRAQPGGVARWINVRVSGLIVTDNESISVEFTRVTGAHISLQRSNVVAPSRILSSTIEHLRVIEMSLTGVRVARSNLFGASIHASKLVLTGWSDTSLECAELRDVHLERSVLKGVRADGSSIRQLKWTNSFASGLSLSFASVVDWESVGGRAEMTAEHSTFDGFTWWKAELKILANDARIGSLRMCDGVLFVRGTESTLQSPVVRRSVVHSDGASCMRVTSPDITNSQVSSQAGWINRSGGPL